MKQLAVKFRRLANAGDLALPSYATSGAAGADLAAAIDQPICLKSNMRRGHSNRICHGIASRL